MSTLVGRPAARCLRWKELRRPTKILVVCFAFLVLAVSLEAGARLYWWRVKGVARITPEAIWRTSYEEIAGSGVDEVAPFHADSSFDVLLLAGSVLHPMCGDIAPRLRARLEERLGQPVRVINLAFPGRTSRDSLMKYARLEDRRFDLVVVYHGINDAFLNNCPPGAFRADYSTVRHIGQMQSLARHPEVSFFALPYTAEYIARNLGDRWGIVDAPRHRWIHYGSDVRTPPAFEANLSTIATIAEQRGDPLLLATFAYYFPPNYSEEAFKAKTLDYDLHGCAAGTWGEPANLARAIDCHNQAVRRVAASCRIMFADIAGRLPGGRLCFDDPCHLNAEGCRRFVQLVVEAADPSRLGNRQFDSARQWASRRRNPVEGPLHAGHMP
jgi:hypothetical protein